MMAGIRGRDTKPEMALRRALHARGLRYRLHAAGLPGKPDMVFPRHRAVVFVHGCFWHRHQGCRYATNPSTRPQFWQTKFAGNIARDRAAVEALYRGGWRVAIVWECAVRSSDSVGEVVRNLSRWIRSDDLFLEIG